MKTKIVSIVILSVLLFGASPALAVTYGVQIKTKHCIVGVLPDIACSPGAVLTTNVKTICTVGYTKTVRDVSTATKKKVFSEYDIPYSQHSNYEVDHIISLELGGSNDISNLFPESYLIKNNARVKDVFENYLHKQVCNGSMSITEAQAEISSNWLTYYTAQLNPVKVTAPQIKKVVVSPLITSTSSIKSSVISPPVVSPTVTAEPAVKKSSTGICHARGTTYYSRTTNYVAYSSVASCLASGGRLPAQ